MGELVFIGVGLVDEEDLSLRALKEIEMADFVYAEFYTNCMNDFSLKNIECTTNKRIEVVSRTELEELGGELLLEKAKTKKVAFLVPGDPFIATTHIDLRIRASRLGIRTRVVHGVSIVSAAISLSGLQNYKFGRSVTFPFSCGEYSLRTPYNVVSENKKRYLHTLCFMDVKTDKNQYLTIQNALESLLDFEKDKEEKNVTLDSLVVGLARVGAEDVIVRADKVSYLKDFDFGKPPHVLVIPSERLHFMEADALISLAGAPEWVKGMVW